MSNPIFCSSCGYTPHGCDPCRERLLDEPVKDVDPDCGLGYSALEIHDGPNRFDPFETLDNIKVEAQCASTRACDLIRADVHALRACITGMEK